MTGVLLGGGNLDANTQTGKTPSKDEDRDLQAKECQRLPANHQKLGERHGIAFSLPALGRN